MRTAWMPATLLAVACAESLVSPREDVARPAAGHRAVAGGNLDAVLVPLTPTGGDLMGAAVAVVGDTDGDGIDDVVAGAWGDASAGRASGAVWVFVGGPSGPAVSRAVRVAPENLAPGDAFGAAVATAGDLDGDGLADAVIGAWAHDGAGTGAGAAWVLSGSDEGAPELHPITLPAVGPGDAAGRAVGGGGDVDGDGSPEIIVGAFGADPAGSASGETWVIRGGAADLDADDGWALVSPDAAAGDWAGVAVSDAGDVDGDGYDEVLVGTPGVPDGGAAWLWFGGVAGPSDAQRLAPTARQAGDQLGQAVSGVGDLDGDGHADVVIGAPGAGDRGAVLVFYGAPTGPDDGAGEWATPLELDDDAGFGASVAAGGDLNSDGYDDLLVGAPLESLARGGAWVLFGAADGLGDPQWLDGGGQTTGDALGAAVAGSGDVDGDGFDDAVVGAYGDDRAGVQTGAALVFLGCGGADDDGDGVCTPDDCDDTDRLVGAGFPVYPDADDDGFGDESGESWACVVEDGWTTTPGDCDDGDRGVHPTSGSGDEGVGDGTDSNCDGHEVCWQDLDGDGHATREVVVSLDLDCDDLYEAYDDQPNDDCDDFDGSTFPGAEDVCGDGVDSDCDGVGLPSSDEDGDGLSGVAERGAGTDPCSPDTDGDGLSDGEDDDPLLAAVTPRGGAGDKGCASASMSAGMTATTLFLAIGLGLARREDPCPCR